MSDKSRKDFEAWAITTGFEDHHFALRDDGEYEDYDVRRLFAPWQASRAAIEVELREAYRKGWDASGEGWNAEFPGDLHEKESWQSTRDESLGLKVKA
jgi:hypothetical protein